MIEPQPQISINDHTILGPQEGLLTPPYIPLNTDTIAKRGKVIHSVYYIWLLF